MEVIIRLEGKSNSKIYTIDAEPETLQALLGAINEELSETESLQRVEFIPNEPS